MGDTAEYIPVQYKQAPPAVGPSDVVFIVDFCYPRDVLVEMANKVALVVVLDHHKTSEAALKGLEHDNMKVFFDMNKSGAVMTWEYFHPDRPVPLLLNHIQDRDLWRFERPGSSEIHRALGMYKDWTNWAEFLFNVDPLIQHGGAIERYLSVQIDRIIANPPSEFFATDEVVPVYNMPGFLISDGMAAALQKYPECRYAVGYIHMRDKTLYSLRSRPGTDVDVSDIALRYGGGGHKHAAGFSITHDDMECLRLKERIKELEAQISAQG
jgi:oligoribonuclease NrnB/cAMP/cGMP phosphodiesterase (DHH superfamily)